jgi:SAM-dependent methyltransferase
VPEPTEGDEIPISLSGWPSAHERIKAELRWLYASLKESRVRKWASQLEDLPPLPDRMQLGERGNDATSYMKHVISRDRVRGKRLVFVGCGNGLELLLGGYFGAAECVGIEFLSYEKSWAQITEEFASRYPKSRVAFFTVLSLDPAEIAEAIHERDFDLAYTSAVLEHVRDLRAFLANVRAMLGDGGAFFSVWGPMWWAYGGDHIAPELGFDQGFIHLKLSEDEYDKWYRAHPRNRSIIEAGRPTWKDHDLYSFLRYREYDDILKAEFDVRWRHWIWSAEAVVYERQFPGEIAQLAATHAVAPYDLYLKSAAVYTEVPRDRGSQ